MPGAYAAIPKAVSKYHCIFSEKGAIAQKIGIVETIDSYMGLFNKPDSEIWFKPLIDVIDESILYINLQLEKLYDVYNQMRKAMLLSREDYPQELLTFMRTSLETLELFTLQLKDKITSIVNFDNK